MERERGREGRRDLGRDGRTDATLNILFLAEVARKIDSESCGKF